jgi:hypothetical protein
MIARLEIIIVNETRFRYGRGRKGLLARWNDAPKRTAEEVVGLLRRVQAGHKPSRDIRI